MKAYMLVLLGLGLVMTVQAKYEFTQNAKDCISEVKTDEETIRSLVTEEDVVPEDNELVQQFFECIFRSYLNDNNGLVVDEKLTNYVINILSVRMNGKRKLATLVAKDCLEHCKDLQGDTKGKTAVVVMNCLKKRFKEFTEE